MLQSDVSIPSPRVEIKMVCYQETGAIKDPKNTPFNAADRWQYQIKLCWMF